MLQNGILNVLELRGDDDWNAVRRRLTDEQISKVYQLYEGLWPLETDLLELLPKPDGRSRAIYTGPIHPATITDFALGSVLYFGEVLIEHPFVHAGILKSEFNPVKNPKSYRQEFLKAVSFFFMVMPLVERGLVNLIPDPCSFDSHLRTQMLQMARNRSAGIDLDPQDEPRVMELMREQVERNLWALPEDALRRELLRATPELDDANLERALEHIRGLRESDPLAVLQEGSFEGGGQLSMMKLAPNFEIAMYLAQATGASILTDSPVRWAEIQRASRWTAPLTPGISQLVKDIESQAFKFPQNVLDILSLESAGAFSAYPEFMGAAYKYSSNLQTHGPKANREAQLVSRFSKLHKVAQSAVTASRAITKNASISCVLPANGIQDNTVNRLLLMSSSERHLPSVPMAFFVKERAANH